LTSSNSDSDNSVLRAKLVVSFLRLPGVDARAFVEAVLMNPLEEDVVPCPGKVQAMFQDIFKSFCFRLLRALPMELSKLATPWTQTTVQSTELGLCSTLLRVAYTRLSVADHDLMEALREHFARCMHACVQGLITCLKRFSGLRVPDIVAAVVQAVLRAAPGAAPGAAQNLREILEQVSADQVHDALLFMVWCVVSEMEDMASVLTRDHGHCSRLLQGLHDEWKTPLARRFMENGPSDSVFVTTQVGRETFAFFAREFGAALGQWTSVKEWSQPRQQWLQAAYRAAEFRALRFQKRGREKL
jgi:hypothetical protein